MTGRASYHSFVAPVRAKCRRLLGDASAAEDATQETFLRMLRSAPQLATSTDTRAVMAWLYRTCTNISIDVLRERRRRPLDVVSEESMTCGVDLGASLEARSALAKIAGETPDDELAAAVLCRVDALTQPEAAEVLNISERSVRRLLERFDERLKKDHS